MKNTAAIAFCLLLLSAPLSAQEKKDAESAEEAPVKIAQAETEQKRETQDPDDYKASEEISEDLSVSYPVDI